MVSVHRFAMAAMVASSYALTIPSLASVFELFSLSFSDSASSELEKIQMPEIIATFPDPTDKPVPGNAPIVQCDALEVQILDLQKVLIHPNPPARGKNLTFLAVGMLNENITEGAYVEVDVKFGFIKLIHQTFDLCDEIQNINMTCPIIAGEQVIIKLVEIPAEIPPGKYIVNAKAFTKDNALITCLTATVDFPPVERKGIFGF